MYLFFDTETTDLPRDFDAPESDVGNWPRVIQIAWVKGESLETLSPPEIHLIKPDDSFVIAPGALEQHGITTEFAIANGVSLSPVLASFVKAVNESTTVVAHNIAFDKNVIGAECARAGIPNPIHHKELRCTMQESTNYCRFPSSHGFKYPRLTELHTKLFGTGFANAHDALGDCLACMNCFFRLQELKVM